MMFDVPLPDALRVPGLVGDEPDSQFPAVALLVHDDEVIGPDIAWASIGVALALIAAPS